jgi:hypothetical protein
MGQLSPEQPTYGNVIYLRQHPAEFAEFIADVCNGMKKPQEFTDMMTYRTHRTIQQVFMGLIVQQLRAWAKAKKEKNFDLRNEQTVTVAEKIVDTFDEDMYFPLI